MKTQEQSLATAEKTFFWACAEIREARAALSRLIEPGDELAGLCVQAWGPTGLMQLLYSQDQPSLQQRSQLEHSTVFDGDRVGAEKLRKGLDRWRARLERLNADRDMAAAHAIGGGFLIPEDEVWPQQLDDLASGTPFGLWFRLTQPDVERRAEQHRQSQQVPEAYLHLATRLPEFGRSVGIIGSREVTDYGYTIANNWANELTRTGMCVISGGAYGVDAAAHRGALDSVPPRESAHAIAVLAGGVDKLYPSGNQRLLHQIMSAGIIFSEVPVGSAPTRYRFLHRNRIIAALAACSVVVQARWRSGALSTANHALSIGRPVGAVPGSIFEPSSAGCHRLLRETPTVPVTDTPDILQLILSNGSSAADAPILNSPTQNDSEAALIAMDSSPTSGTAHSAADTPYSAHGAPHSANDDPALPGLNLQKGNITDKLDEAEVRIFEALPLRGGTSVDKLCDVAGLALPQVLNTLTRLQRKNLVSSANGRWRRST